MSVTMAVFTYINAWWISLFLVWPFGVEAQQPGADKDTIFDYDAAPKIIRWKKTLLLTSIVSAFITALLALVIHIAKQP